MLEFYRGEILGITSVCCLVSWLSSDTLVFTPLPILNDTATKQCPGLSNVCWGSYWSHSALIVGKFASFPSHGKKCQIWLKAVGLPCWSWSLELSAGVFFQVGLYIVWYFYIKNNILKINPP